jgi:hypothetical protein
LPLKVRLPKLIRMSTPWVTLSPYLISHDCLPSFVNCYRQAKS